MEIREAERTYVLGHATIVGSAAAKRVDDITKPRVSSLGERQIDDSAERLRCPKIFSEHMGETGPFMNYKSSFVINKM